MVMFICFPEAAAEIQQAFIITYAHKYHYFSPFVAFTPNLKCIPNQNRIKQMNLLHLNYSLNVKRVVKIKHCPYRDFASLFQVVHSDYCHLTIPLLLQD